MFIIWNLELILVYVYLISLLITIVSANFDYKRRWVVGIGCLTDSVLSNLCNSFFEMW